MNQESHELLIWIKDEMSEMKTDIKEIRKTQTETDLKVGRIYGFAAGVAGLFSLIITVSGLYIKSLFK